MMNTMNRLTHLTVSNWVRTTLQHACISYIYNVWGDYSNSLGHCSECVNCNNVSMSVIVVKKGHNGVYEYSCRAGGFRGVHAACPWPYPLQPLTAPMP